MADNIEVLSQEQPVQQPTNDIPAEIRELMAQRLDLTPTVPDAQQPADEAVATAEAQTQTVEQPAVVEDPKAFYVEYGYQTPDEVATALKEYQTLKAAPPQAPELKFENEVSEKLFHAIKAGNTEEVLTVLSQQRQIESLTSAEVSDDNAESIIKLGMKFKHPDLNDAEIAFQYKKQFGLPKEPVQKIDEDEEEFEARKADWQEKVEEIRMARTIEAKLMKPELQKAKASIVLPDMVGQDARDNEQASVDTAALRAETKEWYAKNLNRSEVKFTVPFIDEANNIKVDFAYEPDEESFQEALDLVTDENKLWQRFYHSDGSPNRQAFFQFVYKGLFADKQIAEAMKQTKNATLKSQLPDNSGSANRENPVFGEPSEFDKQMQASLGPWMR